MCCLPNQQTGVISPELHVIENVSWLSERLWDPSAGCSMLVLSRKKNESIVINDDIIVTVVEVRGDKVRLGIQAPREVTVHRKEVLEAILRDTKPSISSSALET